MNRKYLIGEIAQYFDISTDTLRYYDKQGILSPLKDKYNGYRYYTYDDLIKLTYLITLKSLDVKLDDIKRLLTNCTLQELKCAVEEQEKLIEERLLKLTKLKNTISNFKDDINLSLSLHNKYEIIEAPRLLYKFMDNNFEEKLTKEMKTLDKHNIAYNVCYSDIITKDYFTNKNIETSIHQGFSGIIYDNDNINFINIKDYCLYEAKKSLHTIIKISCTDFESFFNEINMYLKKIINYLNNTPYTIVGDTLCRYITFENYGAKTIDYVEIWVPVE